MRHVRPMTSFRPSLVIAAALLLSTLGMPTDSRAESLIVFKATGIGLKPGQAIDGAQPLTLTAGQKVELIAANGRIIKLAGPYKQPPAPGVPDGRESVASTLKSLIATDGETLSMGVTRSATDVLKSGGKEWLPEPWLINVTQPGTHCQREGQPVVFWRPANDQESEIRLATDGNTWKANTRWPAGADKLAPPPSMPLKDGAQFKITLDAAKTDLTVKLIPEQVSEPPVLAAWLLESGCRAQSLALLRTLP